MFIAVNVHSFLIILHSSIVTQIIVILHSKCYEILLQSLCCRAKNVYIFLPLNSLYESLRYLKFPFTVTFSSLLAGYSVKSADVSTSAALNDGSTKKPRKKA